MIRLLSLSLIAILVLSGCGSSPKRETSSSSSRPGGYYQDDGPGTDQPDLSNVKDAQPKSEPLHKYANRPYTVLGKSYTPYTSIPSYKARGTASWYGKKFHGQKTSSGEIYDMYAMTAAHTTLPLPSYVRVTNLDNKKSVIVRINDRGPFHSDRIIDLSYAAASKLGIIKAGKGYVEVESIQPSAYSSTETVVSTQSNIISDSSTPIVTDTITNEERGLYLQLAAFSSKENAESFLQRIRAQTNLNSPTKISSANGLFRIYVGPYPNRDELSVVQEQMHRELGIKGVSVVH